MDHALYKASFEGSDLPLAGTSCLLAISVGRDYHEGARLAAAVDLINRRGFAFCTVGVGDTLQRHNMPSGSMVERHAAAARAGREWLARNREILARIAVPTTTVTWDDYIGDPRYGGLRERVETAYRLNEDYRNAIEATIEIFLERAASRGEAIDRGAIAERCRRYILEEAPVIMPLWAEEGHDYILYPQRMTPAMAHTRALFVATTRPTKAQWLPIKFKKRAPTIGVSAPSAPLPLQTGGRAA